MEFEPELLGLKDRVVGGGSVWLDDPPSDVHGFHRGSRGRVAGVTGSHGERNRYREEMRDSRGRVGGGGNSRGREMREGAVGEGPRVGVRAERDVGRDVRDG